jgi:hypothetical protein
VWVEPHAALDMKLTIDLEPCIIKFFKLEDAKR